MGGQISQKNTSLYLPKESKLRRSDINVAVGVRPRKIGIPTS